MSKDIFTGNSNKVAQIWGTKIRNTLEMALTKEDFMSRWRIQQVIGGLLSSSFLNAKKYTITELVHYRKVLKLEEAKAMKLETEAVVTEEVLKQGELEMKEQTGAKWKRYKFVLYRDKLAFWDIKTDKKVRVY
jgi:hypothetical protein